MVRRGRIFRLLVSLLAALPLALVACGGGSSSDDSSGSKTNPVAGAGGTTGAGGATGATGAGGTASKGTSGTGGSKSKRKSSTGSGGAGLATGGGSSKGKDQSKTNTKPKKRKFLPGSFVGQKDLLYKQSKTVCHALTLDGLAHEYNVKPKTPATVARQYAKAYPTSIRGAVYRGCKAGLS